ncbi:conserved unknown protein [Ectocarpus siliculosus]|uniref:Purple acid phosphatase n=1 Tax=Ectocarpus siliculosus TaxID=2880 RepID=D8LBI4_ECTSI|nr:conserved unknown protein [Ectocarpus siliculosus]|eukprot:CBN76693.1 conserved unknown protein [Ectocarpus siliculosus]
MALGFFLATAVVAVAVVSSAPVGIGDGAGVRLEHKQRNLQQDGPASSMFQPDEHGLSVGAHKDQSFAAPEQVHIALARSDSPEEYAVTVAWVTWPNTQSRVAWGSSVDNLGNIADGTSTTYSARHPGRADYTSGFLHSATLQGLEPSSTYFYSCGDDTLEMSSVRSFDTPPKVGPEQPITLGVLGDLGQTDDSAASLAAIDGDNSIDLVLHAGDLSYADCDQPRWDSFMRMLDPVASRLPWMVAAGNHEIETNGAYPGAKPFLAYESRFRMPAVGAPTDLGRGCGAGGGLDGDGYLCGEGWGADEADAAAIEEAERLSSPVGTRGGEGVAAGNTVGAAVRQAARGVRMAFDATGEGSEDEQPPVSCCPSEWSGTYDYGNSFYSFDVGPVHVVALNPYTATGENSVQYSWLQKDLESADRALTPWLVVMMHCPWYNSNLAHQGERQAETAMRAMEPLLHQHKAAVVITGHVHAYERSHPVVDFELAEDGPIHLVVGGAGNREGHAADFYPKPEWSAFRDGTVYGSGRLSIRSSSLALWEWTASTRDTAGLHDVAWVSNPFSPYTPGEEDGDASPLKATGRRSDNGGDSAVSASHERDNHDQEGEDVSRTREKAGLRIHALPERRTRRVARG